jgi:hypothetical protein
MSRRERDKGNRGELEVAAVFRARGFDCDRVPNSGGLRLKGDLLGDVPAHLEVKRQETARPWQWFAQAEAEAPAGVAPVVAFRRSRSKWLAIVELEQLADLMAAAGVARAQAGELAELELEPLCRMLGCTAPATRPSQHCAAHDDELRAELGVRPYDRELDQ